jgi:hypothetical protein
MVAPSDTAGWAPFTRPDFRLHFRYPAATPGGHAAERIDGPYPATVPGGAGERSDAPRGDRVHLTSPGSQELYVEVVRFPDLSPQAEYEHHRAYLEQRFGAGAITALREGSLGRLPAHAFGLRLPTRERSVLLVRVGQETYRIIHDPRSPLNAQVVATMAIVE